MKKLLFLLTIIFVLSSFRSVLFADDHISVEYQMDSRDRLIMSMPATCHVTTTYYGYVYDPIIEGYSDLLYFNLLMGTGFVVNADTGHIVTAYNVIKEYPDIYWDFLWYYIWDKYPEDYSALLDLIHDDPQNYNFSVQGLSGSSLDRNIWVQFNKISAADIPENPPYTYMKAQVIDSTPWEESDIAILQIQPEPDIQLTGLTIEDTSKAEIFDNVNILGYPWAAELDAEINPSITSGTINSRKTQGGIELFQVEAQEIWDYVGGPVLDEDGYMIGMFTIAFDDEATLIIPGSNIKEILDSNNIANEVGKVGENFAQGLAFYRMNHFYEALNYFNTALELNHQHLQALEYRERALAAIDRGEDIPFMVEGQPPVETSEEPGEIAQMAESALAEEEILEIMESIRPSSPDAERASTGLPNLLLILLIVGGIFLFIVLIVIVLVIALKGKKKNAASDLPKNILQVTAKQESGQAEPGPPPTESASSQDKTRINYCPSCGNKIEKGEKFCSNCGNKLN